MVLQQNCLLNNDLQSIITPEFQSVLSFLQKHPDLETWPSYIPFSNPDGVLRIPSSEASSHLIKLITAANGVCQPVIITDANATWPASSSWTMDFFQQKALESPSPISVRVNNRAPARHADKLPCNGGAQLSIQLPLLEYLDYMKHMPDSLDQINFDNLDNIATPFYLNGWRAFTDIPSLQQDCPSVPEFSKSIDDTLALLAALDAQLFNKSSAGNFTSNTTTAAAAAWCHQVNDNLRKLFLSPPGALTRLHYDAGAAHGWLAQISGRKLFILYPPSSDTKFLYPLESEIETVQSPIDPLNPDINQFPDIKNARPLAVILRPSEVVVIPQGWWHYAVALDKSITMQRNFYHAGSNAQGLVQMVLKTAASLRKKE